MSLCSVFPNWTQVDSYRDARSPAWSERPTLSPDTSSVSYEKAPRFPRGKRRDWYLVSGRSGTRARMRALPSYNGCYGKYNCIGCFSSYGCIYTWRKYAGALRLWFMVNHNSVYTWTINELNLFYKQIPMRFFTFLIYLDRFL